MDGNGSLDDSSPVNRESSKVQAVVAIYPATDFIAFARGETGRREYVIEFLGAYLSGPSSRDPQSDEAKLYREASPVSHITGDDPPFLLFHGDAAKRFERMDQLMNQMQQTQDMSKRREMLHEHMQMMQQQMQAMNCMMGGAPGKDCPKNTTGMMGGMMGGGIQSNMPMQDQIQGMQKHMEMMHKMMGQMMNQNQMMMDMDEMEENEE